MVALLKIENLACASLYFDVLEDFRDLHEIDMSDFMLVKESPCTKYEYLYIFLPNHQINDFVKLVKEYDIELYTDIDFTERQAHTYCELLYIGYYEPSLKRLAQEWGMSDTDAAKRLKNESTHTHVEFSFFESLYHRSDVDHLSPVQHVLTPLSTRESE